MDKTELITQLKGLLGPSMTDYQAQAMDTYKVSAMPILYPALGLNGEAGEVAEKVKKVVRDKGGVFNDDDREALALELGDVLWYTTALCNDLGLTLSDVAEMNLKKLQDRKKRGVLGGNGDAR